MSGSGRTGRTRSRSNRRLLKGSPYRFQRSLNCSHSPQQRTRRHRHRLRAFGRDRRAAPGGRGRREDCAVVGAERRTHPPGQRRIPRGLPDRPGPAAAAIQYAATPLPGCAPSSSACVRESSCRRPGARSRIADVHPGRARSPTSRARARGRRHEISSWPAPIRRSRRPRPADPSKNSAAPSPTTNSIRSRAPRSLGVEPPQPIAGVGQILGRGALAIALEVRARGNQVGAVGALGNGRPSSAAAIAASNFRSL